MSYVLVLCLVFRTPIYLFLGGLIENENGKAAVIGVTSLSIPDLKGSNVCDNTKPQVFTDVKKFIPWIKRNMY